MFQAQVMLTTNKQTHLDIVLEDIGKALEWQDYQYYTKLQAKECNRNSQKVKHDWTLNGGQAECHRVKKKRKK